MNGIYLKFFVHEHVRHDGILLYEWLLENAKKIGVHGGSAFRAIAGFGEHGILQEEHFFEMAGNLPIEVVFMVSAAQADQLIALINHEKIHVFYVKMPAEYGVLN